MVLRQKLLHEVAKIDFRVALLLAAAGRGVLCGRCPSSSGVSFLLRPLAGHWPPGCSSSCVGVSVSVPVLAKALSRGTPLRIHLSRQRLLAARCAAFLRGKFCFTVTCGSFGIESFGCTFHFSLLPLPFDILPLNTTGSIALEPCLRKQLLTIARASSALALTTTAEPLPEPSLLSTPPSFFLSGTGCSWSLHGCPS